MNKAKVIWALLYTFIMAPIWFYLMYFLLKFANAGPLEWFLYVVYVPVNIFITILIKIGESE